MSTEDDLRDALKLLEQRAPTIRLPGRTGKRPGRVGLAGALAAAMIVLIAVSVSVIQHPLGSPHRPAGSLAAGLSGHTWLVTRAQTPHASVDLLRDHLGIPGVSSGDAWVQFLTDGKYVASDGVIVINGTYRVGGTSITYQAAQSWTPTFDIGPRYEWAPVISTAVDAVVASGRRTSARLSSTALVLRIPGYRVELRRDSLDLGLPRPSRCRAALKCAPPIEAAANTVHLEVAGRRYTVNGSGSAPSLAVPEGASIAITVTIDRPVALPVSDLYLSVNSYPSGSGPSGPTGRQRTIAHQRQTMHPGTAFHASWTPVALFGTTQLDLTLEYGDAFAGVSYVIAHLRVTR